MSEPLSKELIAQLKAVFRMPSVQTMKARTSSITNAFVNALLPRVRPTPEEIFESLHVLGMSWDSVECIYCGNKATEWDHLRPTVVDRRPTGYISEIQNLVPSCNKCNQSKGNSHWYDWMTSSTAKHAPAVRAISDLDARIMRLRAYENWRPATLVPIETVIGSAAYSRYWAMLDQSIEFLNECQVMADDLKKQIAAAHAQR